MRVLLASPRGFCAGVDRAVQAVELALGEFGSPVYVRREIVHNSHVVDDLRGKGAVFVDELADVPSGAVAILSAHGVAPEVYEQAAARSLRLIDATCPLVTKVHLEVHRFVKQGYHIVLIGHAGHEEVIGTIGESPSNITLVEDAAQAQAVVLPSHEKLMVLTQTTLSVDDARDVTAVLRERFDHLDLPPTDDVCYATQNRQEAVKAMADRGAEVLLVVGSQHSSNAVRLVEKGRSHGMRSHLIDGPADVRGDWFDGVECIALTAGASTPESVVEAILDLLKRLGAQAIEEVHVAHEDTVFRLPAELLSQRDDLKRAESRHGRGTEHE
jgi:4-hydroxy-3-methylbut-2-enyl diphosphate reductase